MELVGFILDSTANLSNHSVAKKLAPLCRIHPKNTSLLMYMLVLITKCLRNTGGTYSIVQTDDITNLFPSHLICSVGCLPCSLPSPFLIVVTSAIPFANAFSFFFSYSQTP